MNHEKKYFPEACIAADVVFAVVLVFTFCCNYYNCCVVVIGIRIGNSAMQEVCFSSAFVCVCVFVSVCVCLSNTDTN
jgi:hypothetical protein